MGHRIYRSYQEPKREGLTWDEEWAGDDSGLITCWEIGREIREKEPKKAENAENGELPVMVWKGGAEKATKKNEKYGTLHYLAVWQGLRGEDLDIDLSEEREMTCSRTGMKVIYTGDIKKYGNAGVRTCPAISPIRFYPSGLRREKPYLSNILNFVAIDVETANADLASICQIGVARYVEGELESEWSSLIDPEDYFDFINIDIHGITEEDVVGCPTFPEVVDVLGEFINNTICVSHTHFDRVSISRALAQYELSEFDTTWLDSARVARRTWEEFAWNGYGLANVCNHIGYKFKHHDALEDAKASAHVLLAAIETAGLDIESWLARVKKPIDPERSSTGSAIRRDGNPEGELYGEVIVFTGALDICRREAADIAAQMGCSVGVGVTKKTSLLVVGDQDVTKLAGKNKSSKHIKAEALIKKGQLIRIIRESDFKELARHAEGY